MISKEVTYNIWEIMLQPKICSSAIKTLIFAHINLSIFSFINIKNTIHKANKPCYNTPNCLIEPNEDNIGAFGGFIRVRMGLFWVNMGWIGFKFFFIEQKNTFVNANASFIDVNIRFN